MVEEKQDKFWEIMIKQIWMAKQTYQVKAIVRDGNCFYRTIALGATGKEGHYKSVKR